MRYRLAIVMLLLLLAMLPVMNVLAVPVPDPSGILDISTPSKWETAEQHLQNYIEFKTDYHFVRSVYYDPEVRNLPSVASSKDAYSWLAKNLRVTPEKGDRLLRLTFRAGKRNEQVTIINAFLRAYFHWHDINGTGLRTTEEHLGWAIKQIRQLEGRIEQQPYMADRYREAINHLRNTTIPDCRARIAASKQYAVIRWAR